MNDCYVVTCYGSFPGYLGVKNEFRTQLGHDWCEFCICLALVGLGWCLRLLLSFHTFTYGTWKSVLGFREEGKRVVMCVFDFSPLKYRPYS